MRGNNLHPDLGRNHSEHFPASSRFPFLAGEFKEIGIVVCTLPLKVSGEIAHSPERTALGQDASSFSILHFFPELA